MPQFVCTPKIYGMKFGRKFYHGTQLVSKNVYVVIQKSKNLHNYLNNKKNINKTLIYFKITSVVR